MNKTAIHNNQPSYMAQCGANTLYVTRLGGMVLPYYPINGIATTPYCIAPWCAEHGIKDPMLYALRGSFLCFPMGGDADGFNTGGIPVPSHGSCANEDWELTSTQAFADSVKMTLDYTDSITGGNIKKELTLMGNEPVLYERDTICGYTGKYPLAFHPNLRLNDKKGSCHVAMSTPLYGTTTRTYHEQTENGGYVLLKKQDIPDYTHTESVYGDTIDLSHQPLQKGIEEMVIFVSDQNRSFCYTALTNPEEGYVYFQLKNPKKLQSTMLWISNGGRHYAPWNGRNINWIGMEETTSYFHYGTKTSVMENPLQTHGAKTFTVFSPDTPYSVELISGVAPIPATFTGVKDIISDNGGIKILGENDEQIFVKVDLSFLA